MPSRPNIVWFITDDTGFDMLGHTSGRVLTPNIDRIAREGVRCTSFHTASPACGPSRYSYLTGLYPGHCPAPRFRENHPIDRFYRVGFDADLLPPTANVASILKQHGYTTGYVGKYHTGTPVEWFHGHRHQLDDDPGDSAVAGKLAADYDAMRGQLRGNGFDYAEGIVWGNVDTRPIKALRYHNLEWSTAAALRFVDQSHEAGRPFFLKMATTVFHGPHHIASLKTDGRATEAGFVDPQPEVAAERASIFARLEAAGLEVNHQTAGALWADDALGAVMQRLDELGLADDTIIIFSTDHGPGTTDGKFTCYQGGTHIPFCVKWPGRIEPGSTCDALLQNVDVLPTLLSMIDVAPPMDARFDGLDRWAQLRGAPDDREDLYFEWGRLRAVRTRRWKYIALRYTPEEIDAMRRSANGEDDAGAYLPYGLERGGDFPIHLYPAYFDADQLYDLASDPGEQRNLAEDPSHAAVVAAMRERLARRLAPFAHPYPPQADPFQRSPAFAELTHRNADDGSIYEQYFYAEHAY